MTQRDYLYAQCNGYKGTFEEYCQVNYAEYCKLCARVGLEPSTFKQWMTDAAVMSA